MEELASFWLQRADLNVTPFIKGIETLRVTSFPSVDHGHQETMFYCLLNYVLSPDQMSLQLELFQPTFPKQEPRVYHRVA